jgi:hypothetical protein
MEHLSSYWLFFSAWWSRCSFGFSLMDGLSIDGEVLSGEEPTVCAKRLARQEWDYFQVTQDA